MDHIDERKPLISPFPSEVSAENKIKVSCVEKLKENSLRTESIKNTESVMNDSDELENPLDYKKIDETKPNDCKNVFQENDTSKFNEENKSEENKSKLNENEMSTINDDLKESILEQAMKCAKRLGWSKNTLQTAAQDMGYMGSIDKLFPEGPIELVLYARKKWIKELAKVLEEEKTKGQTDWLNFGMRFILERVSVYKKTWYQTIILGIQPSNMIQSMIGLNKIFDLLYKYKGDQSIDLSYYSKRMCLTLIYTRTELFLMFDNSKDNEETWKFLKQQIDALMNQDSFVNWATLSTIDLPTVLYGILEAFTGSLKNANDKK